MMSIRTVLNASAVHHVGPIIHSFTVLSGLGQFSLALVWSTNRILTGEYQRPKTDMYFERKNKTKLFFPRMASDQKKKKMLENVLCDVLRRYRQSFILHQTSSTAQCKNVHPESRYVQSQSDDGTQKQPQNSQIAKNKILIFIEKHHMNKIFIVATKQLN